MANVPVEHWLGRVNQVVLEIIQLDNCKAHFNNPKSGPGGGPCFAAILQRLMDGAYASPAAVHADICAIWDHCRAVHPPGSEPAAACEQLAPLVDQLWRRHGLGTAPPPPQQQQQPAGSPGAPGGLDWAQQLQQQAQQQAQQQQQQAQLQQQVGLLQRWASGSQHGPSPSPSQQQQQQQQQFWGSRELPPAAAPSPGLQQEAPHGLQALWQQQAQAQQMAALAAAAAHDPYAAMQLRHHAAAAASQQRAAAAAQEAAGRDQRLQALLRLRAAGLLGGGGGGGGSPELERGTSLGGLPSPSLGPQQHQHMQVLQALQQQQAAARGSATGTARDSPSLSDQQRQLLLGGGAGLDSPGLSDHQQRLQDAAVAAVGQLRGSPAPSQHAAQQPPQQQQQLLAALMQAAQPGPAGGEPLDEHDCQRAMLALLKQNMLRVMHQRRQQGLQAAQAATQGGLQHHGGSLGAGMVPQDGGSAPGLAPLDGGAGSRLVPQGGGGPLEQQLRQQLLQHLQAQAAVAAAHQQQPQEAAPGGGSPGASFGGGELTLTPPGGQQQQQQRAQPGRHRLAQQQPAADEAPRPGPPAATPLQAQGLAQGSAQGGASEQEEVPRRCLAVLERLAQFEDAEPFLQPVDAEGLGIPRYRLLIKHPMDLGTVRTGILQGRYSTAGEVAADVALVWANCRAFNAAGSPICDMAARLELAFKHLWQLAGLGPLPEPPAGATPRAATRASAPPGGSPRSHAGKQQSHYRGRQQPPAAAKPAPRSRKRAAPPQREAPPQQQPPPEPPTAKQPRTEAPAPLAPPPASLLPAGIDAELDEQAEVAEEARQLQSLLGLGGAVAGDAPPPSLAAPGDGSPGDGAASPLLWHVPGPLGDSGPLGMQAAAAAVHAADARPPPVAPPADTFARQWQAASAAAAAAAPVPQGDGGPAPGAPHAGLPQQASLQASLSLSLPAQRSGLLRGLEAATARVTPEQLQQEQAVLAAWRALQEQRRAARAAAEEAEAAAARLARARQELAAAQASPEADAAREARPASEGEPALRNGSVLALAARMRQARYNELLAIGTQLFGGGEGCSQLSQPALAAGAGAGGSPLPAADSDGAAERQPAPRGPGANPLPAWHSDRSRSGSRSRDLLGGDASGPLAAPGCSAELDGLGAAAVAAAGDGWYSKAPPALAAPGADGEGCDSGGSPAAPGRADAGDPPPSSGLGSGEAPQQQPAAASAAATGADAAQAPLLPGPEPSPGGAAAAANERAGNCAAASPAAASPPAPAASFPARPHGAAPAATAASGAAAGCDAIAVAAIAVAAAGPAAVEARAPAAAAPSAATEQQREEASGPCALPASSS